MHSRGFATVRDRQVAWNLARGGVTVVLVDFSSPTVTVGRVKARWRTTNTARQVGQLLPRAERDRLAAEGSTWLDTPVTVEERDAELPLADPEAATHFQTGRFACASVVEVVVTGGELYRDVDELLFQVCDPLLGEIDVGGHRARCPAKHFHLIAGTTPSPIG